MKNFEAQVSLMTEKNASEIWEIWTDITSWPHWDDSKKVEIDGQFKAGSIISCYSEGDEEPRRMEIISAKENQEFIDQAILPFGKILTYHTIKHFDDMVQVTHKMKAEINDDMADMFGKEIWPHIQSGIFVSLNRLINL